MPAVTRLQSEASASRRWRPRGVRPVIVAAAALDFLAAAGDQLLLLQGVQGRIDAAFAEREMLAGFRIGWRGQFRSRTSRAREQFEQQQFGHAVQEIRIRLLHVALCFTSNCKYVNFQISCIPNLNLNHNLFFIRKRLRLRKNIRAPVPHFPPPSKSPNSGSREVFLSQGVYISPRTAGVARASWSQPLTSSRLSAS